MAPEAKRARVGDCNLEQIKGALMPIMQDYALTHGLAYVDKDTTGDASRTTQCPVAMLPFKLPAEPFHHAAGLSDLWNKLVDKVSRDLPWLYSTLDHVLAADPFTKKLVEVCKEVHSEGLRQPIYLGIHRSDYMLHEVENEAPRFLQVELNTISSSMGTHACNIAGMHSFLMQRFMSEQSEVGKALREHFGAGSLEKLEEHIPSNCFLKEVAGSLAKAHAVAGCAAGAAILMVVQPVERNFADQRFLEWVLWEDHRVPIVRRTLTEIATDAEMDQKTGKLSLKGGPQISVVYYRSGYGPDCYPTETEWSARLLLEKSAAIKCPSVAYQLVGAKKVQQALAKPGALERFLPAADAAQLRTCFAGLWGLGPGENDDEIVKKVLADPTLFVMKPQREGGGYNFYGQDVATKLKELKFEDRGQYILMQRIVPKAQAAILTRQGTATIGPCVSEFGFYSVFVGDEKSVHLSAHAGHLVRSKLEGVDEGGVAAGFAVISSPFLETK